MRHTNKASAPVSVDIPEFEGRYVDLDGHTVGFEIYKADDPWTLWSGPCAGAVCADVLAHRLQFAGERGECAEARLLAE